MEWLSFTKPTTQQTERLNAATRGLMAAQAGANAEAEAVARTAASARCHAVTQRAELREHAARVQSQSLHTGEMLKTVEEMLAEMQANAERRANRKH